MSFLVTFMKVFIYSFLPARFYSTSRTYLKEDSLFHYYQPLQVAINKDDKLVENVPSASECATKCDKQSGNLHCRSFNFCPDSNQCYLSNSHLSLSSPSQDELVCFHYSSYSKRFQQNRSRKYL
jgi:hypothetical protein